MRFLRVLITNGQDSRTSRQLKGKNLGSSEAENVPEKPDFHFFWLWPVSLGQEEEICLIIEQMFNIGAEITINWPIESSTRSFNRLYARNLHNTWSREMSAGSGTSKIIVVSDPNPHYTLATTSSGEVKWANRNVLLAKTKVRSLVEGDYAFGVHSSSNPAEFERDLSLALGPELMEELVEDWANFGKGSPPRYEVRHPLVGHFGWDSWEDFFSVVSRVEPSVILSGEESLSLCKGGGDVDILVSSIWSFAATANAQLELRGSSKPRFVVTVAGEQRLLDLTEVGDGRLPVVWQERLLSDFGGEREKTFVDSKNLAPLKLFKALCEKSQSDLEAVVSAVLDVQGMQLARPKLIEMAATFVAGYMVSERIPLVGLDERNVRNTENWELIGSLYAKISSQAEKPWNYDLALD